MEFILNEHHRNVPDEELLKDVKDVATRLGQSTLTIEEYEITVFKHMNFCKIKNITAI